MTTIESGIFANQGNIAYKQTSSLRASMLSLNATITLDPVEQASGEAMVLVSRITGSTLLSGKEKSDLIRLTAIVDEFAGNNRGELLEKVGAIIAMTEKLNDQRDVGYARMTYSEGMQLYWMQREALREDDSVLISVELEIMSFQMAVESQLETV